MRLLIWSWNSESARFGETLETERSESVIDWDGPLPTVLLPCNRPDFVQGMAERVAAEQPELVVVGLQEDPKPGSYWLCSALPQLLTGYSLLEKTRLMGIGLTTWTRCYSVRGLRLAVFVRQDWELADQVKHELCEHVCAGSATFTRGKGAVGIVLDIPQHGRLELINAHLPFDSASLGSFRLRAQARQQQADHLEQLHAALVVGSSQPIPGHIVLMGDLNFRLDPYLVGEPSTIGPQGIVDRLLSELVALGPQAVYQKRDELRQVLEQSRWLGGYREGVDDAGPTFPPTCKLRKQRPDYDPNADLTPEWLNQTFQVQSQEGRRGPRTPGFADRILFRSYGPSHGIGAVDPQTISCLAYERWDLSSLSDHAAVMAMLNIAPSSMF